MMFRENTGCPDVAVVIPHRGADDYLAQCLDALRNQTYPSHKINITIVLNEPSARPVGFSLRDNETLLWHPQHFSYAARNAGIMSSNSDIIALTDSDTVPSHDWIARGVEAIMSGPDIVAGKVELTFAVTPLTPAACYEKLFAFDQEKNVTSGYSATANLFARSSVFTTVGPFDEHAHTGEDFAWTRKAVSSGAHLIYSPEVIVSHPARESMRELFLKAKRTSSLFIGTSIATGQHSSILRDRLRHDLLIGPSQSKKLATTASERLSARVVRVVLLTYKALRVLRGGSPPINAAPDTTRANPVGRELSEARTGL